MKPKSTLRSYLLLAGSSLFAVSSLPAATFYWDNNGTVVGFGNAGGNWAQNSTSGGDTARWKTDPLGLISGSATQTTANTDIFNFGSFSHGLGAGTINVNVAGVTMGNTIYSSLSGAVTLSGGTITFSAAPSVTVNNTTNTIGNVIAGAATSFTKAGAGALVLTGANTYAGTTIINGGTLNLGGGTANGSLASTALTLGGGALSYTRTGTNTHSFTTGTTINAGASTVSTDNASNTIDLNGLTRTAPGGSLAIGSTGTITTTTANTNGILGGWAVFDNAGTVTDWAFSPGSGLDITGGVAYYTTTTGGNTATNYVNQNTDVDSNQTFDAALDTHSLRFNGAAPRTLTLQGNNVIQSGGILVTNNVGSNLTTLTGGNLTGSASGDLIVHQHNTNTGGGLTIDSIIQDNVGATALTKTGGGLLTLNASNTFTGGVFLSGGQLLLGNAGALNGNNVTFGGSSTGALTLNGNSITIPVVSGSSAAGAVIENANATNATLTINSGSNSNFGGIIRNGSGAGTLALTKSGTGTLTLSGANTYSGGTTLSAGTVNANNGGVFGAGTITVTGNSRINVVGGLTYANGITVNASQTLTLQNPAINPSTATFSGVLAGSGSISLPNTGANGVQGILDFTNTANTFDGNVVLSASGAGDEHFKFASIGDGGNFTFAKNGNRQLITYNGTTNYNFATRTIAIATTMTNGGTTDRQGMDGGGSNPVSLFANDGAGTVSFTQNMVVNNFTTTYGVLYFGGTNTGNNTFSGNIGDTSDATSKLAIGKFGAGKWILSGSNTYEGDTLIGGGTLSVGSMDVAANAQPLGKGATIQLGVGNGGANGTLEYTGGTASTDKRIRIGTPLNAGQTSAGSILNNGSGALTFTNSTFNPTSTSYTHPHTGVVVGLSVTGTRTLTLGGSYTGGTNEIQGVIQDNVATTGKVNLTVNGSFWQISGANTFSGNTTVTNNSTLGTTGRLKLNYSTQDNSKLSDTGSLTLGPNTTLELIGGNHTEIVASTTISSTSAAPASVVRTGGTSVLQMGAITRNTGAYITFSGPGIATTNTLNNAFGILGTWATVNNGNDWAVNSTDAANGPITAPVYTNVTRLGGSQVIADSSTSQVRIIEGAGSAADITLGAATTTIATLTQSTTDGTGVAVIDPAGQTLAVGAILAQNGAGSLTIGNGTNNGNIQALSAGGDLVVNTVGSSSVTINSTIADNTSSTLTKIGTGTLVLTGTNTYAGGTTIINNGGTLSITNPAALGGGAVTISTAGTNTGTLELALSGTNSITNAFNGFSSANSLTGAPSGFPQIVNTSGDNTIASDLTITGTGGSGLNVASNGGLLTLTGTITHTIATARTLSLGGSGNGVVSGPINNNGAVNLSVIKSGSGTWTLSNTTSTYAGNTTISGGTLAMGANDVLPASSAVLIGAGTLDAATYTDTTAGTLDVTAAATINLGSGGTLAFANSSAVSWTGGTLNITGTFVSGSSIRFGTTSGGLTPTQLGLITVNGSGPVSIDASGYLTTGAVSGFAAWQAANSTSGGRDEDHDGDGVDNGTEHFLGGTANTTGFTALPGVVKALDGTLSVTWTKAGTYTGTYGTDYVVETSATLSSPWTTETLGVNVIETGNDVKYTFPGGPAYSGKNFARLKVTGP